MRHIIIFCIIIVSIFLVFSSTLSANSQQWQLAEVLEIHTFVDNMNIQFLELKPRNISNIHIRNKYNTLKRHDQILRNIFIREFQKWNISKNSMADIVHNYTHFIYFANKVFLYHELEENIGRTNETRHALQNWYNSMRTYYMRIQNIVRNR